MINDSYMLLVNVLEDFNQWFDYVLTRFVSKL